MKSMKSYIITAQKIVISAGSTMRNVNMG